MDKNFHQKVRKGFLEIARNNPKRVVIIDGSQNEQNIHNSILQKLNH